MGELRTWKHTLNPVDLVTSVPHGSPFLCADNGSPQPVASLFEEVANPMQCLLLPPKGPWAPPGLFPFRF
jgi:hypothetical protein